jgi:predicted nucleotidyltransferase component of viral defense system
MSRKVPVNLAASVRQKLLNAAHTEKVDFQRILGEYVMERTLWRLENSGVGNELVFKGGCLIGVWLGRFRGTRDLDFSAHRELNEAWLHNIFLRVSTVDAQDGLRYDQESIHIANIRVQNEFQGLRLSMGCYLEQARVPLQVDVGFSPNKAPGERIESIQSIIDKPPATIWVYSPHAVIGEKVAAVATHGEYNSRMKDFYDIVMLSRNMDFTGADLSAGIRAAFLLNSQQPPALLSITVNEADSKWNAFLRKSGAKTELSFAEVKKEIEEFINPCLAAMANKIEDNIFWQKNSGWQKFD